MTSLRVDYSRKIGQADFSSLGVGGSIELTLPDEADWQSEYTRTFAVLKEIVDAQALSPLEGGSAATTAPTPAASLPVATAQPVATPEVSQAARPIVPKEPRELTATIAGRVFHNRVGEPGKEHVKVRVKGIGIPESTDMKSFDLALIPIINALKQGDTFTVRGYFDDPYNGKSDLRAQELELAG